MVDDELVRRQLAYLETAVRKLRELSGLTPEEMRQSVEKQWAVLHGLQIAIQGVLDIGNHLLAAAGVNGVEDYGSIIDKLGERGILSVEFSRRIRPMAGFRNLLVHGYARVDEDRVALILRDHLDDFQIFSDQVMRYLDRQND